MADTRTTEASIPAQETRDLEKSTAQETKSTSTTTSVASDPIGKAEDPSAMKSDATDKTVETSPPEPDAEDHTHYPSGFKLVTLIIALCMAVFLVALDQTIIATAIPRITDHFHSINDIGWYGSAYFLTSTALQPTFGRVYKVFSVKTVFLCAISVFELGSLICGVAPSSTALIVGRAVAGIGVGGIFSGGLVIIAYSLPLQKRPMVFGFFGAMWGLASIAGPLLGGVFTDHLSWRWCFYINLPIGAVSIAVVLIVLRIPRDEQIARKPILARFKELDYLGAAVLVPGIICLLLAVQWGGSTYPWKSSRIIGLLVGAILLLLLFAYTQYRLGEKATIPPRLLKQRTVVAAAAYVFFFGAGIFVLMYYLPLYLQSVKGSSPTRSGIQILPLMLSTVLSSILAGAAVTFAGYYTPFLIGSSMLMTIGAGLITTFAVDTPFPKWFGYQVLTGLGTGVGFQVPLVAVQTVLPMEDIPQGTVLVMFFQSLGGALFIAVGQTVFANGFLDGLHKFAPTVNPQLLTHTGATAIRSVLAEHGLENELRPAIMAFVNGLQDCYRVVVSVAAASFVASCFLEWRSVKNGGGQGVKKSAEEKVEEKEKEISV